MKKGRYIIMWQTPEPSLMWVPMYASTNRKRIWNGGGAGSGSGRASIWRSLRDARNAIRRHERHRAKENRDTRKHAHYLVELT